MASLTSPQSDRSSGTVGTAAGPEQTRPTTTSSSSRPPPPPPASSSSASQPAHNGSAQNGTGKDEQHTGSAKETPAAPKQSKIPPWIMNNIKDPHSLKMLFRCWLASWVCIILLPIDSALQVLGQAAFFVCMVTAFLPANLPVFSWIIANGTLVFGSCMGWAWGCAAMAAALKARDSTLLQSQLQRVQSSVAGATNPEQEYQAAIFRAEFLDPRSSTVFGVFLAVGSYVAALIFTQSPKLRFAAIFMVIVLDVMASYGPLFPVSQYTLGSIFLLPIGVSLGISFACMLLIFPETLSWGWQRNLSKLFKLSRTYLATHNAFLSELAKEGTSAQETLAKYDAKLQPLQAGCIALIEVMQGQKPFLHMEITYASLSGKDLAALLDPVKQWIMRSFGLMAFNFALSTATEDDVRGDEEPEPSAREKAMRQDDQTKPVHVNDTHALMYMRRRVHRAEKANHVSFKDDLLPLLVDGSRDVLSKAFHALDTMTSWLDYTNEHRYFGQYTAEQHSQLVASLQQAADELEESLQRFENDERIRLVMPYEKHFAQSGTGSDGPLILRSEEAREYRAGARSLFICLVWCFNVIGAGRNLVALTRAAHDTAVKRPKSKVWYPTGLRKLGHLLVSKDGGEAVNAMPADSGGHSGESTMAESMHDEEADDSSLETKAEMKERKKAAKEEKAARRAWGKRDADALAPSSAFHHFGRGLASAYRFAWSPRGLFALRFTIAGMALWIPAVINQPVAAFSYNHRVLWAIIMAQLGVSLSQGEQVFSLMSRVIGTVLGAMLGAALWYISCGNSPAGNPYGYGAVTAVAFIPMVFLRLFAPLSLLILCLMTFVTMILVMGYSWIDAGHLVITADSGIGIGVAWRRMLLVLIGIAASVIVTLFPRPSSTREVVRLSFAKLSGRRILNLYSKVIEAWATHTGAESTSTPGQSQRQDEQLSKSPPNSAISAEQTAVLDDFRGQLLAAYAHYRDLTGKVGLAKLDLQIRGKWPAARYGQLLKTHRRMLLCLGQLYVVLAEPDYNYTWRRRFAHMTSLLDPSTIADICTTLSLVSQALETGRRLPHASTLIRERAMRNQMLSQHVEERLREQGSSQASEPMSFDVLKSSAFMKHVTASVALHVFLDSLDETTAVCRNLVGEVPLPGFEALKDGWDDRIYLLSA